MFGHAIAGKTPDKPWTDPQGFRDMFARKYQDLLTLRTACGRPTVNVAEAQARFEVAKAVVNRWVQAEEQAGVGDPSGGSEQRWDTALKQLFGPNFDRYTSNAMQSYTRWLDAQRKGPWKRNH